MRYMLLIYSDADPQSFENVDPAERKAVMDEYFAFTKEMADRGLMQGGEALLPPTTATSVRVRGGETVTTDGPFAETKEWLGGYFILDCKDLDEAIECAAKIPDVRQGAVEIRPIVELPAEYTSQS